MPDYCRAANVPLPAENGLMRYIGAIVPRLNDTLVEMKGALSRFTLALPNNRLIALAGFIPHQAAPLARAASEFLSPEAAANSQRPWIAAIASHCPYKHNRPAALPPFYLAGAASRPVPCDACPDRPLLHSGDSQNPACLLQVRLFADAEH